MNNHIMLDLETFGVSAGSVLRSIGAVVFDPETGQLGDEFYRNICRESCEKLGMTVDPSTVEWWNRQSKEAQDSLKKDPRPMDEVGKDFCAWFSKNSRGHSKVMLWSQGSNFDGILLDRALQLCGLRAPWKFYSAFDTRTAYFMGGFDPFTEKRLGTYHNALADAKHQAKCVHKSYVKLRKGGML